MERVVRHIEVERAVLVTLRDESNIRERNGVVAEYQRQFAMVAHFHLSHLCISLLVREYNISNGTKENTK
jgi:hypothetical protein